MRPSPYNTREHRTITAEAWNPRTRFYRNFYFCNLFPQTAYTGLYPPLTRLLPADSFQAQRACNARAARAPRARQARATDAGLSTGAGTPLPGLFIDAMGQVKHVCNVVQGIYAQTKAKYECSPRGEADSFEQGGASPRPRQYSIGREDETRKRGDG